MSRKTHTPVPESSRIIGSSRNPLSQRAKRLLLGVAIALAVSLAATGTILAATGTILAASQQRGHGTPLITKQQRIDASNTQEAEARLVPAAPKGSPVPTAASCPLALHTGIIEYPVQATFGSLERVVNQAFISYTGTSPYDYYIYAGWSLSNTAQGMILVQRDYYDSCSAKASAAGYFKEYLTPYQKGGVHMTSLQGDTIPFTTLDGASGSFNYVTGQFS